MIQICDYEVKEELGEKQIAIYGCGKDGSLFWKRHSCDLNIICFIDKSEIEFFEEKPVYSPERFFERYEDIYIVICSKKYEDEMISVLKMNNYREDLCYIWDKYYTNSYKRLLEHNRKYLLKDVSENPKGEIIVPIEGLLDGSELMYGYISHYFAKQNNSQISAYIRRGGTRFKSEIPEYVLRMYKSFGVDKYIDVEEKDDKFIRDEYERVLSTIKTLEDWENVIICGMNMGISVIRDYLRFYELSFEPLNDEFCECLYNAVKSVVFWEKYVVENNVKMVILWDGVHNESYLREIAIKHKIPTYIIQLKGAQKATTDFNFGCNFSKYKEFFDNLSDEMKKEGLEWAHKEYDRLLAGEAVDYRGDYESIYKYTDSNKYLSDEENIKIMICPHIFDEDEWNRGDQVCNNNYLCWYQFLGEMSEKTDYDWYIKLHPDEGERGIRFIKKYIEKYPNIKLIKQKVSPIQLSKEGINYVITIGGSVGHEYPLLGVDVINGGNNPHISFDFNINPNTKEELASILMNLKEKDKISKIKNKDQIYEYYCTAYKFYPKNDFSGELRDLFFMENSTEYTEKKYDGFLDWFAPEKKEYIYERIGEIINKMNCI